MKKYIVWLILAGFGAWVYNEHRKATTAKKPKLK